MGLSWVSLLFLTFFWFNAFGVYEPSHESAVLYIVLAAVFASASCAQKSSMKLRRGSPVAPIIKEYVVKPLVGGISICALILAAQGALFPFLYLVFTRYHAESVFAAVAGALLKLTGFKAAVGGDVIFIEGALRTVAIASAWEKVGAFHFILFLAGGCALLALKKSNIRRYLLFFGITFIYALIRYAYVLAVYVNYGLHGVFWDRMAAFLLFMPLTVILSAVYYKTPGAAPFATATATAPPRAPKAATAVIAAAAAALVFFSAAFFGWRDAGSSKPGRVLVDEYHSDWEWTDEAYDENWFGERSGYNYYCFYEHIDRYFTASRNNAPITPDALAEADILILKTPTMPYGDADIAAVTDFVYNGGGVYLIGDHTNVFGSSMYLNQIASNFGMRFRYDCTYELTRGNLQEYNAPPLFPHPVVKGLPHFLFATSCTLDVNWLAEEAILGYGLRNLPLDYSQKNFFPADEHSSMMEFGVFTQSAGVQYGKGRVLAFTDSTVFSNFWMFMPGKPELLLNSLQWLNHENRMPFAPRLAAVWGMAIALAALIFFIVCFKRRGYGLPSALCACAAAVALLFSVVFFQAQSGSQGTPEQRKPYTRVCFESEYTTGYLPNDLTGFLADMDRQISTFYVWTQRLGYVPSYEAGLAQALVRGDLAVTMKPDKPIGGTGAIIEQIEGGAMLFVLDNGAYGDNTGELLARAGMRIVRTDDSGEESAIPDSNGNTADIADHHGGGRHSGGPHDVVQSRVMTVPSAPLGIDFSLPLTAGAAYVEGGEVLLADDNGRAIFSAQTVGNGKIAVFTDPDLFYNASLGDISANLTESTQRITRLEFQIFKYLLE